VTAEHLQGVGNAIANQTNETAKLISSYRYIPELNHHLMEGLQFPESHKKMGVFVFFPSKLYDKRVQIRFDITKEVVEKNGLKTLTHKLKSKSKIEEALELIGFGSYMTMYLSLLYKQDPSVIPWVDYFKRRLKELS
jgi:glucose/mannose-6-phosphate isomerase